MDLGSSHCTAMHQSTLQVQVSCFPDEAHEQLCGNTVSRSTGAESA